MSNFYTLLTRVGAALHANAQVNQTTVPWTHMRLGDGNGAAVAPTENQTGLVRQVHTLQITDIAVHPDNPNWVIAEAVVPSDVGGWTVREAAIYGGADGNTCIAVGNYPETYKPVLAEGAGREMVMRMVVEISSVATVKLQIDPAVAIASRAWVESLKAAANQAGLVQLATNAETQEGVSTAKAVTPAALDARTATEARTGIVELATTVEAIAGTDESRAVTPAGVKAAIDASAKKSVTLYPNNGTSTNPAQVSAGGRYEVNHPFPGKLVLCQAEILIDGDWMWSGFHTAQNSGWFVAASPLNNKIVVQAGTLGVYPRVAAISGAPKNGANLTSAPCRVHVTQLD